MPKCEAKAGNRLLCKLEQGHDEPFGPLEMGDDRPRRPTPHVWNGRCDVCGGDPKERPAIRVHEEPEGSGRFFHLCGRCQDRGGSTTSGMIVNRHRCACGKPATRWLEAIQAFLCAACGPDREKVGAPLTTAEFAALPGSMTGLFPIRREGDFFDLFEIRIAAGQVTRTAKICDRLPFWEVLDVMEQRAREQVTEAPQRAAEVAA
jgi:hypothetical protein